MISAHRLLVSIHADEALEQSLCFHLVGEGFEVEPFSSHCANFPSDDFVLLETLKTITKTLRVHFLVIEYGLLRNLSQSALRSFCDDIFPTHCIFLTPDQIAPAEAMRIIKTESGLVAHEHIAHKDHLVNVIGEDYSLPALKFEDTESSKLISKVSRNLEMDIHEDDLCELYVHELLNPTRF